MKCIEISPINQTLNKRKTRGANSEFFRYDYFDKWDLRIFLRSQKNFGNGRETDF